MDALIVDDNVLVCIGLERMLARRGIAARVANSGAAARREMSGAPPDLVLLDLHLPDTSGLELLAEIRSRSPQSSVVMISSEYTDDRAEEACAAGALGFLDKSRGLASLVEEALSAVRSSAPSPPPGVETVGSTPGRTS